METPTIPALETFVELHPADAADQLQRIPVDDGRDILCRLAKEKAALILAELDKDRIAEFLLAMSSEQIGGLLAELHHSAAADLVERLPEERRGDVLRHLPSETSARIQAILKYGEDTAGGIMSDRFIALREAHTVQQCQELLSVREEEQMEDVSYLYVTDSAGRLKGVVSLRDLVFRRPERQVGEIMNKEVKWVRVDADQEAIARQFQQYHYLGLPVLEGDGRLVGVVRANDVIGVLQEEATEDMQLMVGLSGEERALSPWGRSVRRRLPWLYLNMATAFLAAAVVGLFESTIAVWPVLAVFMPIVAGMGGNAGAQTLTIIIRDLALGELSPGDGRKALVKEAGVAVVNGIAIGIVVALLGYVWKGEAILGLIAGAAMILNLAAAGLAGVLIPYTLKACKIDPALASSIFVTTITDVCGFFFFLGLAAMGLKWAGGLA